MSTAAEETASTPGPQILLVEDEVQVRKFLRASLVGRGFRLVEAGEGRQGLQMASEYVPDLVLLDLGLPDMDGLEVARRIREWSQVPIIVLSARGEESQKVEALDAGADDYLTKPFSVPELLARIRVALRHAARIRSPKAESEFTSGDLRVDLAARMVYLGGRQVHLTPIEYRMLIVLVQNAGKVVTQRQLLQAVWGPDSVDRTHYLRVHMAHIRHKLEENPARPRLFLTEAGVGYRLAADE